MLVKMIYACTRLLVMEKVKCRILKVRLISNLLGKKDSELRDTGMVIKNKVKLTSFLSSCSNKGFLFFFGFSNLFEKPF